MLNLILSGQPVEDQSLEKTAVENAFRKLLI